MPKRMKRTKKASEATKNKVYNSYYNFIDFKGLDEYNPDFTLGDVVEWMVNDSGATKGSDKYKVVAYVAVAMAKTWRNLGLTKKIDDNEYEAIDFNYDLGDGDSYDESEWKGVKDVDDTYLRDYGMRNMSFPKINDSFDESKKIVKESVEDEEIKQKFCEVIAKEVYDKDLITLNRFKKSYLKNDSYLYEGIISKLYPYADRIVDIVINYIKDVDDKFKNESKKPAKNDRRAIIEKYAKVKKQK